MTRKVVGMGALAAGLWALLALQASVAAGEPPREGRRRPAAEGEARPDDLPAGRGPREGDDRGPPREGRRGGDAERGPRPERDGPPPKPPRDGGPDRDGDRPPPKPPRGGGEFGPPEGGPPPKPPRDGGPEEDMDRPLPKPPREGGFGPHGMRPPMGGERPQGRPGDPFSGGGERPGMGGGPDRQRFRGGPPMDWEAMEKNDPEMFKLMREDMRLEQEAHELAMKLRQAPPERRDALKQEVRELVAKHFDVRQERRTMELKRLENEINRVRESLEKRLGAKDQIIKQRVRELLGPEDDLTF